jgi:hypothetical protein
MFATMHVHMNLQSSSAFFARIDTLQPCKTGGVSASQSGKIHQTIVKTDQTSGKIESTSKTET